VQWYINPFKFFERAFKTENIPKPDITTLAGRRIYYSHIDGDGWNSISLVPGYKEKKNVSAKVIFDEMILSHPELPVTVAPIAADLDLNWVGMPQSGNIAKEIFLLENVEMGSHTYSHPFEWGFFKNYQEKDELPYLDKYQHGTWKKQNIFRLIVDEFLSSKESKESDEEEFHYPKEINDDYDIPRAYANKPFDLKNEIFGARDLINQYGTDDKVVKIIQWSGDCQPFEKALTETFKAGLKNINGGDTRFDDEYNSYAWVRPISKAVGDKRQIFSSMSNENTYTDLWTKRFYGFNLLPQTFYNTEIPIRLRPINLYYHMYSGEKFASLEALRQNIEYIVNQDITPIETSLFTSIVEGFYSTKIYKLEGLSWLITDRGELQTIRFDNGTLKGVDFSRSDGVIGQVHHQGKLYVYLDSKVEKPTITLKKNSVFFGAPDADSQYLMKSNWRIWDLNRESQENWSFVTSGYGNANMEWYVPLEGRYKIMVVGKETLYLDSTNKKLEFVLELNGITPLNILITRDE